MTSVLVVFGAVTAVGEAVASGGEALWVPGGMFLTGCELLRRAAIAFKEARQIDVDGARKREAEAEAELNEARQQRDDIRADRDTQIQQLREEVNALRNEVSQLKGEHRTTLRDLEERHANDIAATHRRLEREIRVAYRLREHMAHNGLDIPEDLLETDHAEKGTT